MLLFWLLLGVLVCAIQAIRSTRLLLSALWLVSASALVALVLYALGAHQVAVVELSVGAGLVTVMLVYAIAVTGDQVIDLPSTIPWPLALALVGSAILLLGWLALPLIGISVAPAESTFRQTFWELRGPDVLAQIVLLFVGALGVLGLLAYERQTTSDEGRAAKAKTPSAGSLALRPVPIIDTPEVETTLEEVEV